MAERPYGLPPHGSRRRYRVVGCRCVACTRGPKAENLPSELRWPFRWFDKAVGTDRVEAWFDAEQIATWKAEGMGDYEADEACVKLDYLPHDVFPGYTEAGLDCEYYP